MIWNKHQKMTMNNAIVHCHVVFSKCEKTTNQAHHPLEQTPKNDNEQRNNVTFSHILICMSDEIIKKRF
jgi:hypothetical protein